MTDELPDRAVRAFDAHGAFERNGAAFELTTTPFASTVTAAETDEQALRYRVRIRVPTLSAATEGPVAGVVEEGWFETFELRLEDAPMAVRDELTVDLDVEVDGDELVVRIEFEHGNADYGARATKALCEYVEGTYVEGIVPGYEYRPPVADLLASARRNSGGSDTERGPMPL